MHPDDFATCTTQRCRDEFFIQNLFQQDTIQAVYSHVDRMVTVGILPVSKDLTLDDALESQKYFGTDKVLSRREAGIFNIGGAGVVEADGQSYNLGYKDCLYIGMGASYVTFKSQSESNPAKFYMVLAPAHCSYPTKKIGYADAVKRPMGTQQMSNVRVINQYIHPSVLKTCQLSMGLTELQTGSVWNTMPVHTHERRMEIYLYFEVPQDQIVFHMMGQPWQTRHIVMQNEQAVISPSWSIHAGCGTQSYSFIWAMGGENQEFDDMDHVQSHDLK